MTANEFIQKFKSLYENDFEYEWDEDLQQISFFFNIPLSMFFENITLDFEGDSYSLYREFLYEECDNKLSALSSQKEECLFYESLKETVEQVAEIAYKDGLGCPFYSVLIGYFDIPFSWEDLACKLNGIIKAFQYMKKIRIEEVDKESELLLTYKMGQLELYEKLGQYSNRLCNIKVENSSLNSNKHLDGVFAYTNRSLTIITGIGLEFLSLFCSHLSGIECFLYLGLNVVILSSNEPVPKAVMIKKNLFNKIIEFIEQLGVNWDWNIEDTIKYSITSDGKFLMCCGELWFIVCPLKAENYEEYIIYEKNTLKSLQHDFIQVASEKIWNQTYDFSRLNGEQFEKMCCDFLYALKFQNISIRGKSRAADGGVDITAEEEYKTLVGTERRKWIFQCKHMKKQIGRKDLSEVYDLLQKFSADCYGLFYSGELTPNTLDRIADICKNSKIKIEYWDRSRIEAQLKQFPQISLKYFGL